LGEGSCKSSRIWIFSGIPIAKMWLLPTLGIWKTIFIDSVKIERTTQVNALTGTLEMKFEIEHWPHYFGKHALARLAKGYLKAWIVFGTLSMAFFLLFYFTHVPIFAWAFRGFAFVLVISPLLPAISYLQRDRKNPSYGINEEGFLLNERGWNSAYFTWDEIASIQEFDHPKFGRELHFEFVNFTKAINKPGQDKFAQSLAREYGIEKQPKKISSQLVKGDVSAFIEKFILYYNQKKSK
jgi:hypothetical protein